jgi:hypothetical protein
MLRAALLAAESELVDGNDAWRATAYIQKALREDARMGREHRENET